MDKRAYVHIEREQRYPKKPSSNRKGPRIRHDLAGEWIHPMNYVSPGYTSSTSSNTQCPNLSFPINCMFLGYTALTQVIFSLWLEMAKLNSHKTTQQLHKEGLRKTDEGKGSGSSTVFSYYHKQARMKALNTRILKCILLLNLIRFDLNAINS